MLIDTRHIANARENVRGEIKLSVQYHRGALTVMVNIHFQKIDPQSMFFLNSFQFVNRSITLVRYLHRLVAKNPIHMLKHIWYQIQRSQPNERRKLFEKIVFPHSWKRYVLIFWHFVSFVKSKKKKKLFFFAAWISNATGNHPKSSSSSYCLVTRLIAGKWISWRRRNPFRRFRS